MSDEHDIPWSGEIQEEQIREDGRLVTMWVKFANGVKCRVRKDVYEGIRASAAEEQRKRIHRAERLLWTVIRNNDLSTVEMLEWAEALVQCSGDFPDADV